LAQKRPSQIFIISKLLSKYSTNTSEFHFSQTHSLLVNSHGNLLLFRPAIILAFFTMAPARSAAAAAAAASDTANPGSRLHVDAYSSEDDEDFDGTKRPSTNNEDGNNGLPPLGDLHRRISAAGVHGSDSDEDSSDDEDDDDPYSTKNYSTSSGTTNKRKSTMRNGASFVPRKRNCPPPSSVGKVVAPSRVQEAAAPPTGALLDIWQDTNIVRIQPCAANGMKKLWTCLHCNKTFQGGWNVTKVKAHLAKKKNHDVAICKVLHTPEQTAFYRSHYNDMMLRRNKRQGLVVAVARCTSRSSVVRAVIVSLPVRISTRRRMRMTRRKKLKKRP
jgi:hypothetical protein